MEAICPTASRLEARERDGVRFYVSPLLASLGVQHAFSTRIGGVSAPPLDTLTLGSPADRRETPDRLAENWRRLLSSVTGRPCRHGGPPLQVHQVHGPAVRRARAGQPWDHDARADAIVSDDAQRPIAVRTADCCPILLASRDGRRVAAIHAGWRGLVAGVIEAAVATLEAPPEEVFAAVGPCIGFERFEVGAEVLAAFRERFATAAPLRERPDGKGQVDLASSAELALKRAGVPAEQIDVAHLCTYANASEFFSHRRDSGITGRMAAVVWARA